MIRQAIFLIEQVELTKLWVPILSGIRGQRKGCTRNNHLVGHMQERILARPA